MLFYFLLFDPLRYYRTYKNKNNQISLDEEIKQNWKALGKDEEGNDL